MEKLNTVKEFERCGECGSEDTAEISIIEKFPYGEPAISLECYVNKLECRRCGYEWTDYRAEEARTWTVLRYLVQEAKNPRAAIIMLLNDMKLWATDRETDKYIESVINWVRL